MSQPERTVKVDSDTGRLIGDLAHVLGLTKKDVVRDAVFAFADLNEPTIATSLTRTASRVAAVSGSLEGARLLAAAGGDLGELSLLDRVKVQRVELVALLERYGGRNPRIVGELAHGGETEIVELLIESDP